MWLEDGKWNGRETNKSERKWRVKKGWEIMKWMEKGGEKLEWMGNNKKLRTYNKC